MGRFLKWLEDSPFLHGFLLGLAFFLSISLLRHLITGQ